MNIQWYPGHMTKARRMMEEDIKLIDIVIELLDARIPYSSRNPDIDSIAGSKSRLIILNKADMADEKVTDKWKRHFESQGLFVLKADSRNQADLKKVNDIVKKACAEKIARDLRRGIKNRPIRAMVVGIPNVGKSTFINSYAKKAAAKTGNKPGVTKGRQWIRLSSEIELLDTPGILWPKFEDEAVGIKLAMIGSVNDDIVNMEELALKLINIIRNRYPGLLEKYYKITDIVNPEVLTGDRLQEESVNARSSTPSGDAEEICKPETTRQVADDIRRLQEKSVNARSIIPPGDSERMYEPEMLLHIAKARGCLLKGGEYDCEKAARLLLENFRNGKLGRISLEEA